MAKGGSSTLTCPGVSENFNLHDHQHHESDLVREFDEQGCWYKYVVKEVLLDKINFKTWLPERQAKTLHRLETTGKIMPIKLGRLDKDTKKYLMTDGNHRCSAAAELGYKSVPALVEEKHTDPPLDEDDMEKWRFYNQISSLLFNWKNQIKTFSPSFTITIKILSKRKLEILFSAKMNPLTAHISKTSSGLIIYRVPSLKFECTDEVSFFEELENYWIGLIMNT